jgi:outer membrane protein
MRWVMRTLAVTGMLMVGGIASASAKGGLTLGAQARGAGGGDAAPAGAAAAPVVRLSLEQAVQRALEMGEEMRSARALLREANGRVTEAASGAYPQINGLVGYTRQLKSIYSDMGSDSALGGLFKNSQFGASNTWNAQLSVDQLLFAGGKVGAGVKAAKAYRSAAHQQERQTAADVALRVKQAYLDAELAARVADIAESSLALARQQLRQVRQYREQGSRAEYDLLRAQVDAANQEPGAVTARDGANLAMLQLKRLVDIPSDQPLALDTPLMRPDGLVPVPAVDSLDSAGRPALVAAEENVRVQEQAVKVAIADRWPSVSANATLSNLAFPSDFLPSGTGQFKQNWSAGFTVNIPLFLGFRTGGAAERARAQLQQAEAGRDLLRKNVRLEVEQAHLALNDALSLLAARRGAVRLARRAFELAGIRYTNGMATQIEVSDARLQLQTAQIQEVQVMRDYLVALAELERAVGRAQPVTLKSPEQLDGQVREEGKQ